MILDRVPCIYYLVQFWKGGKEDTRSLINSNIEINVMTLAYPQQIGLLIHPKNVQAQNINDSSLETHEIGLASFQVLNIISKACSFERYFY